jgi:hypothetical protein
MPSPHGFLPRLQVVIARFDEDLAWVPAALRPHVLVYNKGAATESRHAIPSSRCPISGGATPLRECEVEYSQCTSPTTPRLNASDIPPGNVVPLENVGREGHSWFTHITHNYDRLADFTVFLQGEPFDHCHNVLDEVRELAVSAGYEGEGGVGGVSGVGAGCGESETDAGSTASGGAAFRYLSDYVHTCTAAHCAKHPGLPLHRVYVSIFGHEAGRGRSTPPTHIHVARLSPEPYAPNTLP